MDITVTGGTMCEEEINEYVMYALKKYGRKPIAMKINIDGEFVDLDMDFGNIPFERIRRITGYLVGTLERWNNAKRAEERDRIKHGR